MRRAASLSEQPESTKAKARRRRSSSRSPLPFGLGIGVQAEKQSTYIIGFFLEEIYYILYTWLNSDKVDIVAISIRRVLSSLPPIDCQIDTENLRAGARLDLLCGIQANNGVGPWSCLKTSQRGLYRTHNSSSYRN